MDQHEELAKLKWLFISAVTFLISGYYTYQEFRYAMWGHTAEAVVHRIFETSERGFRGRRRQLLAVEYSFTDQNGAQLSERDDVPVNWSVQQSVTVQYLPGVKDSSRLLGNSHKFAVWIFVGCIVWLGFTSYGVYREATAAVHGKKRRRRQ